MTNTLDKIHGRQIDRKVVVLGAQSVGKSSLVVRCVHSRFSGEGCPSTVGANFLAKRIIVDDTLVRLQIWDTAGQERFRSMAPMYYRGADCAVLCYDVTSASSFKVLQSWMDELERHSQRDNLLIHIVGTKRDLVDADPSKRQVRQDDVHAWASQHLRMPTPPLPSTFTHPLQQQPPWSAGTALSEPRNTAPHWSSGFEDVGGDSDRGTFRSQYSRRTWASESALTFATVPPDISDFCHEISSKVDDPGVSGVDDLFNTIAEQLVRFAPEIPDDERAERRRRRHLLQQRLSQLSNRGNADIGRTLSDSERSSCC